MMKLQLRKPQLIFGIALATTLSGTARLHAQFVEPVTVIHTFSGGNSFGWAVADLKDIDGDQATDLIVGSPVTNTVTVYSGEAGASIHTFTGATSGGRLGQSIADAGDVDDDGINDIIAGANVSNSTGEAFVYSGADGSTLHAFGGEAASDSFGFAVAGPGDVNGDGHADLLVGAPGNDVAGDGSGRAYVFSGLDGTLIRTLQAGGASAAFGSGTAATGDLDGDGIGDLIIGAPGAGANGKAYVYSGASGTLLFDTSAEAGGATYGQFFVAGVSDVDKDGVRDLYVGDFGAYGGAGTSDVSAGADGTLIHSFPGGAGDGVGPGRGAGDVDGDGYADLIIGHWTNSSGASGAGRVVVRSGRTGAILRTITSTTNGENLGFDAVGIGDVNGDGRVDLLVSASTGSRVYVIAGDVDPLPPDFVGGNRTLAFTPPAESQPQAIRVMMWRMYDPQECPPRPHGLPELASFEVAVRWLGPPSSFPENAVPQPPDFVASQLQCCPHFRDWSETALAAEFPDADTDMIHAFGAEVVPCSAYDVQVVDTTCPDLGDPSCYSEPVRVNSLVWGDVWAPFGNVGFIDIGKVVAKFKQLPFDPGPPEAGAPPKVRAMLRGNVAPLDTGISFLDIGLAVRAFKRLWYKEDGPSLCTEVCPE